MCYSVSCVSEKVQVAGMKDIVSWSHLSLWFLQCLLLEFTLFLLVSSEISKGPYTNNLLPFIKCCCTSKILLQLLLYSHLFQSDWLLCFHCMFLFFSFSIFSEEFSVGRTLSCTVFEHLLFSPLSLFLNKDFFAFTYEVSEVNG